MFELAARHDALVPVGLALEHGAGMNVEGWCELRDSGGVMLFDTNKVELVETRCIL